MHFEIQSALRPIQALLALALLHGAAPAVAQPPAGYYDTVDATNATALRSTLHDVIDDHTRFPYTDASCASTSTSTTTTTAATTTSAGIRPTTRARPTIRSWK